MRLELSRDKWIILIQQHKGNARGEGQEQTSICVGPQMFKPTRAYIIGLIAQ